MYIDQLILLIYIHPKNTKHSFRTKKIPFKRFTCHNKKWSYWIAFLLSKSVRLRVRVNKFVESSLSLVFVGNFLQQGVRFDPDMPQTIRLEFAKSNTKVSKPKQQAANAANTHPTLMHPLTGRKYPHRTPNSLLTQTQPFFFFLWTSDEPII